MRRLVEQLFGREPREFASPQRVAVDTTGELLAHIDQHNGLADCYVSAYAFASEDRSYGDVVINKAIFDFDGEWGALVDTHEWLRERGAAHLVVFSGSARSGHIYVLTEPTTHQQSLEYFQRDVVVDGAGLRRCRECGNPVDRVDASAVKAWECRACGHRAGDGGTRLVVDDNLIGDPATMIRVPNTWHPGAERFCVPLRPEEVVRDAAEVHALADSQRDLALADAVSGGSPVEITQAEDRAEELYRSYDDQRGMAGVGSDATAAGSFEAEVEPAAVLEDLSCECLLSMLTDPDGRPAEPRMGHRNRRVLVSYLVERGYNPAEIRGFLRFALDDEKAEHAIHEEQQPTRIWRDGVKAPNAVTLKRYGLFEPSCPEHAKAAGTGEARSGGDD